MGNGTESRDRPAGRYARHHPDGSGCGRDRTTPRQKQNLLPITTSRTLRLLVPLLLPNSRLLQGDTSRSTLQAAIVVFVVANLRSNFFGQLADHDPNADSFWHPQNRLTVGFYRRNVPALTGTAHELQQE